MEKFVIEDTDLAPQQCEWTGPDGVTYLITQASDGAALKWQQAMFKNATVDPNTNKPTSIDMGSVAGADSLLVSLCLFPPQKVKGKDGDAVVYSKTPVDLAIVHSWTRKVVSALHGKIMEMSPELTEKKPPKNAGSAGTDASA